MADFTVPAVSGFKTFDNFDPTRVADRQPASRYVQELGFDFDLADSAAHWPINPECLGHRAPASPEPFMARIQHKPTVDAHAVLVGRAGDHLILAGVIHRLALGLNDGPHQDYGLELRALNTAGQPVERRLLGNIGAPTDFTYNDVVQQVRAFFASYEPDEAKLYVPVLDVPEAPSVFDLVQTKVPLVVVGHAPDGELVCRVAVHQLPALRYALSRRDSPFITIGCATDTIWVRTRARELATGLRKDRVALTDEGGANVAPAILAMARRQAENSQDNWETGY